MKMIEIPKIIFNNIWNYLKFYSMIAFNYFYYCYWLAIQLFQESESVNLWINSIKESEKILVGIFIRILHSPIDCNFNSIFKNN